MIINIIKKGPINRKRKTSFFKLMRGGDLKETTEARRFIT